MSQQELLSTEDLGFDKETAADIYQKNRDGIVKLKDGERELEQIKLALEKTGNNITQASRLLGISRQALYARLKKYGLR